MISVGDLVRIKRSTIKSLRKKFPSHRVYDGIFLVKDITMSFVGIKSAVLDKNVLIPKGSTILLVKFDAISIRCLVVHRKCKIIINEDMAQINAMRMKLKEIELGMN